MKEKIVKISDTNIIYEKDVREPDIPSQIVIILDIPNEEIL